MKLCPKIAAQLQAAGKVGETRANRELFQFAVIAITLFSITMVPIVLAVWMVLR